MMFLGVNIWSRDPFSFLKPACSSQRTLSSADVIWCTIMLQNNLLGTESESVTEGVMSLQLLQSDSMPFFGPLRVTPFVQSDGIFPFTQMLVYSGWRMSAASSGSALKSSAFELGTSR